MKRIICKSGFIAVAVLVMATFAQASNWIGTTGSWGDAANWDDAGPTALTSLANISNGGTAQIMAADAEGASSLRMGLNAGLSGTLDISGGSLTLTSFTNLGENATGTGTVNITDGGTIGGGSSVNIAAGVGSTGTVTISGAGSAWTASNSLWVGRAGNGTLNVLDGGLFSSTFFGSSEIGREVGSTGTATVDGAGSSLTIGGANLIVGANGTGTLNVSNGGAASSLGGLRIGNAGTGTLSITSGGTVSSLGLQIGFATGSTGTVNIDGAGSTLTATGSSTFLGNTGTGTLSITNGGTLSTLGNDFSIASSAGSISALTIDGSGSSWTDSGRLFVGNLGDATLDITNGGTLSTSDGDVIIGNNVISTSVVTVDGSGSSWTSSDQIFVGTGGNGTLNVTNGGTINATGARVRVGHDIGAGIGGGGLGTVNIDGAGSSLKAVIFDVAWERYSRGIVNISDGGLLQAEDLFFSADADPDSVVNVDSGGMLALLGDGSADIAAFLDLMDDKRDNELPNTKNIDYWNGSAWDQIYRANPGVDSDLTYFTTGDLAGYTVFTATAAGPLSQSQSIPEPASLILLVTAGALVLLRRRKKERVVVMRKGIFYRFGLVVAIVPGLVTCAQASTLWWDVSSGDWGTAANWSPLGVGEPTATDFIYINNGGTIAVTQAGEVSKEITIGHGFTESGTLNVTGGDLTTTYIPAQVPVDRLARLIVGNGGIGTVNVTAGGSVNVGSATLLGRLTEGTGTVTVSGAGSTYTVGSPVAGGVTIGALGTGFMSIINGGTLTSTGPSLLGDQPTGSGTLTVDGSGSSAELAGLGIGRAGNGTTNITNGGTLSSSATISVGMNPDSSGILNISTGGLVQTVDLFISADANDPSASVVQMDLGGRLAMLGDGSADIAAFLGLMPNTFFDPAAAINRTNSENIDYWNGSAFDDITNGIEGTDYDLIFYTSGSLNGYTELTILSGLPGDFDGDTDVDGFDFLRWQRGESPNAGSAGDLADWESNFGAGPGPLAAGVSAVPEPSTAVLLSLALTGLAIGLRRRR